MKKWVIGGMAALMVLFATVVVAPEQSEAISHPPTPTIWVGTDK